jgi:hypothetical protein
MITPRSYLLIFFISFFCCRSLSAQETQKPSTTKQPVLLSEQEWKAVEGYFQSPQNKEMYVQFTPKGDTLLAKLLWNNEEIHLLPESPLSFSSSQEGNQDPIHIIFSKDSSGKVNQVNVANNGVWNRANYNKPPEKKEMAHTPEQLKQFEGLYQFQNDQFRFVQFIVKGNTLVLKQHWDGNELSFVPESATDFFTKQVPSFSLSFVKDKDGNITQAIAFKRDNWNKVKKITPTTSELKIYEGKYQFKDDPDNYIRVLAKDNRLTIKQLWDSKEIIVEPLAENYFYNSEQSYPFQVIRDKDGTVKQVLVLGLDLFNKVKDE